jgi:uncharacterized protein
MSGSLNSGGGLYFAQLCKEIMEDAVQGILLPGLMALVASGIAYKLGFFKLPSFARPLIGLSHLLSIFGIYLGYYFVLPFFLQTLLVRLSSEPILAPYGLMMLQFFISAALLLTLLFYIQTEGPSVFKTAFKNPGGATSRLYDFSFGMLIWLIAFPWVAAVSELCDFLLYLFFQAQNYEQIAVRYLKDNLASPLQMLLALISIVIIAPIVEEVLFRGTLQQYLKKFFKVRTSILMTALIFACFHFSPMQNLSNLSLIPSLFVFACFLGYIYERQGSIFASIGLHVAFNLASSLQILFSQGA